MVPMQANPNLEPAQPREPLRDRGNGSGAGGRLGRNPIERPHSWRDLRQKMWIRGWQSNGRSTCDGRPAGGGDRGAAQAAGSVDAPYVAASPRVLRMTTRPHPVAAHLRK